MMKDIRNSRQFYYTQQSLSAFESCPLKFKKRYMEGLRWDSRPDEESKAALEKGNNFHLLAERYFMGVDTGLTGDAKYFEALRKWSLNLKEFFEIRQEAAYHPEYTLRTNVFGMQLEANFDLLVVEHGQATIWDWKTHDYNAHKNPKKAIDKLRGGLQTMVYLFTLGEHTSDITGKALDYEALSMKYWQPDPPQVITEIKYDKAVHESFSLSLQNTINNIKEYDYAQFDKSPYAGHCKHCEFNWYCNA